jgi:enamine deaminase RidA (YjgF/YER057c/UK114 family)
MQQEYTQVLTKLNDLNIQLVEPPQPAGTYVPYMIVPPMLFLSGVTPKVNQKLLFQGKVGENLDKEEGYQAARQCIINHLSTLKAALGDLDRMKGIVKVVGFINADPAFTELSYVLNGASDLLVEIFGDRGVHARSAVGVSALPGGAPVEVEMIVRFE